MVEQANTLQRGVMASMIADGLNPAALEAEMAVTCLIAISRLLSRTLWATNI